MGDSKVGIPLCVLFVFLITPFSFDNVFADSNYITAEDLGILQLAAHDLFNVDRIKEKDFENGKLDLSTLFIDTANNNKKFDLDTIAIGGEPRNRENIMLRTVASQIGAEYVDLINDGIKKQDAKRMIIEEYHKKLATSYYNAFGEPFPDPISGKATMQENLALRTVHDFLPGTLYVDGEYVSTLDESLNNKTLDAIELQQPSSPLDGQFDEEFLDIQICFPPDFQVCITVNLLEADQSLGEQFGTDESFDEFLGQLEDGSYDENDSVMSHIRNLMAKGQHFKNYNK
ncbi:MAG: hypothetical protein PVH93_05005 [Nitrosopumilaceae archaeon]|jgi:hypothetical protein